MDNEMLRRAAARVVRNLPFTEAAAPASLCPSALPDAKLERHVPDPD